MGATPDAARASCVVELLPGDTCSAGRFLAGGPVAFGWSAAGADPFVGEVSTKFVFDNGFVAAYTCTVVSALGNAGVVPSSCSITSSGPPPSSSDPYTHVCEIGSGAGRLTCWIEQLS